MMYDMGFNNPAMPWRELERRLSDRHLDLTDGPHGEARGLYASNGASTERFVGSQKGQRTRAVVPYAE